MVSLYETDMGTGRKHRVLRMLSAFPYLLRHHIQPQCLSADDIDQEHAVLLEEPVDLNRAIASGNPGGGSTDSTTRQRVAREQFVQKCCVDRRTLPWSLFPPTTLMRCTKSSNRPLWLCDLLSRELVDIPLSEPEYSSRERSMFLAHVEKLSKSIGECERIHQTAVPLNYARHSLRSLTLWLFTLPFAVIGDLGLLTGPVMGAIAWLLLGVYQIGYTIEDPFQGTLRLSILCDAIYRDVMYSGKEQANPRDSAFSMQLEIEEWMQLEGIESVLAKTP